MEVGSTEEPRMGVTRPAQRRYHLTSQNCLSLGLPHHPWTHESRVGSTVQLITSNLNLRMEVTEPHSNAPVFIEHGLL